MEGLFFLTHRADQTLDSQHDSFMFPARVQRVFNVINVICLESFGYHVPLITISGTKHTRWHDIKHGMTLDTMYA